MYNVFCILARKGLNLNNPTETERISRVKRYKIWYPLKGVNYFISLKYFIN
jgi:hypothetical protein